MFTKRIKQLRETLQIPQRKLAIKLETDIATCCKLANKALIVVQQNINNL
jgi:DNA-binding transcriptional regulator YiaG